jgi:hypothetical protein
VNASDEMWLYSYDVETKQQSSHWKYPASPRPKRTWQMCSWMKAVMLFLSLRHCALWIHSWRSDN